MSVPNTPLGHALVAAAALFGLHSYALGWRPSEAGYPIQGIDVSHHQGAIHWSVLPGENVDFAYIKASEGGDHRDSRFPANWTAAGRAGIARGAYHFFTLCRPGREQAENFIAAVPLDPNALPPAVDLEFGGNCAARPSRAALLAELDTFRRLVEARYRKPVLLYLTEEFDAAYEVSTAIPRSLWLRSLVRRPDYGARPWTIWQASSFRRVRGIDGPVDWNVVRP